MRTDTKEQFQLGLFFLWHLIETCARNERGGGEGCMAVQSALETDRPAHSVHPQRPQPAITVTPPSLRRPDCPSVRHSPVTEVSGGASDTTAPTIGCARCGSLADKSL